jgi:hypothetical protein
LANIIHPLACFYVPSENVVPKSPNAWDGGSMRFGEWKTLEAVEDIFLDSRVDGVLIWRQLNNFLKALDSLRLTDVEGWFEGSICNAR